MKHLSQFLTESNSTDINPNHWPELITLGDGMYDGAWWGHCFLYDGKKYYVECGVKSISPVKATAVIKDGKVTYPSDLPRNADPYQYKSLVSEFDKAE